MAKHHAILATLEEYAAAYCAKDTDRLMALFDDGEDISAIGTGEDEKCAGRTAIRALFHRNFEEATATRFEWHWQEVIKTGTTAVVATTLDIHLDVAEGPIIVPLRWTVVMVQRNGRWRWLHRHASSSAASQDDGAAYPSGSQ